MNYVKKIIPVISVIVSLFALTPGLKADSLSFVSRTKLTYYPWGVTKKGNILYVPNRGTISIVNVSNPYSPIHIKDHDPGPGSTSAIATFAQDTIIYSRGDPTFFATNISDSINPINLYWTVVYGSSSNNPRGIFVNDNKCYLALPSEGITIFNIIDPMTPDSLGTYDTPGYAYDVFVRDSFAYIADQDSFRIANVSIPSACVRVGAIYTPGWCSGVTVNGNYAYLACVSPYTGYGQVLSVDISDPANPFLASSVTNIQGNPMSVYYYENYLYCIAADYFYFNESPGGIYPVGCKQKATVEGGLRVINVAKPDSIYYVCGFDTWSDPRDAIAESGYVYIADQDSGLVILKHFVTGVEGEPIAEATPTYPQINLYPNPIKNKATIEYTVAKAGPVSIIVYNTLGQTIKTLVNNDLKPGHYSIVWNGLNEEKRKAAAGVYFYRYCSGGYNATGKIVVIR
jgi:hypothetical protein